MRKQLQATGGDAKNKQLERSYDDIRKSVRGLRDEVKGGLTPALAVFGLTAFSVGGAVAAVASSIRGFASSTNTLSYLRRETGLTIDTMRQFESLGERMGSTPEAMRAGLSSFARNMQELRRGVGGTWSFLLGQQDAGIQKFRDSLRGVTSNEEALKRVFKLLDRIPDTLEREKVLGAFGLDPALALMTGAEREEALKQIGESIGKTSSEAVEAAKKFEAAMSRIKDAWKGWQLELGSSGALDEIRRVMNELRTFASENREEFGKGLVKFFKDVTPAAKAFAEALGDIGKGISRLHGIGKFLDAPLINGPEDKASTLGLAEKAALDQKRSRLELIEQSISRREKSGEDAKDLRSKRDALNTEIKDIERTPAKQGDHKSDLSKALRDLRDAFSPGLHGDELRMHFGVGHRGLSAPPADLPEDSASEGAKQNDHKEPVSDFSKALRDLRGALSERPPEGKTKEGVPGAKEPAPDVSNALRDIRGALNPIHPGSSSLREQFIGKGSTAGFAEKAALDQKQSQLALIESAIARRAAAGEDTKDLRSKRDLLAADIAELKRALEKATKEGASEGIQEGIQEGIRKMMLEGRPGGDFGGGARVWKASYGGGGGGDGDRTGGGGGAAQEPPMGGLGAGGPGGSEKERGKAMYASLMKQGFTHSQAVALMGEGSNESGMLAKTNPGEGASGLIHFRLGRLAGLRATAAGRGDMDPDANAEYLKKELTTGANLTPRQFRAAQEFMAAKTRAEQHAALKRYIAYATNTTNERMRSGQQWDNYLRDQGKDQGKGGFSLDGIRRAFGGQNKDDLSYVQSRGGHSTGSAAPGTDPELVGRMAAASRAYEAETGKKAHFGEMDRDNATQAEYYRRYRSGHGGIAAPPGASQHNKGRATDVPSGPFRDWLYGGGAKRHGLNFPVHGDAPHMQMDPADKRSYAKAAQEEAARVVAAARPGTWSDIGKGAREQPREEMAKQPSDFTPVPIVDWANQHRSSDMMDRFKEIRREADRNRLMDGAAKSGVLGGPANLDGNAKLQIELNGFPKGTKTQTKADGIFKDIELHRGRVPSASEIE